MPVDTLCAWTHEPCEKEIQSEMGPKYLIQFLAFCPLCRTATPAESIRETQLVISFYLNENDLVQLQTFSQRNGPVAPHCYWKVFVIIYWCILCPFLRRHMLQQNDAMLHMHTPYIHRAVTVTLLICQTNPQFMNLTRSVKLSPVVFSPSLVHRVSAPWLRSSFFSGTAEKIRLT